MEFTLCNDKAVVVSKEELSEFITEILIPNPYWRFSGLLTEDEVLRYLNDKAPQDGLKKIARYILIYMENIAFSGYLFDKSDGKPQLTKEFNIPVVKKLRELYQKVSEASHRPTDISQDVHEMENICMEIGTDPL